MKDIAIFGAGGWGKEVACLISSINSQTEDKWNLIGFFDDSKKIGYKVSKYGCVLGGMDDLNNYPYQLAVVVAIGNPQSYRSVIDRIYNDKIYFPNLISPTFRIADNETFKIGKGNIIGIGCVVSVDVTIGNFNTFNADIVMGHDVKIGDFNVIMPDIRISGEVTIGDGNLIGVGSIILQQIKVGNGVRLGAGSVLMNKPKDGGVYIGNPAKLFKY